MLHMSRFSIAKNRLLGNSGLRVAEVALGTMTFGTDYGFPHEFLPTQRDIVFGGFYDEIINHRKSRSGETKTGKEYHIDSSRIGN
jgi:hypothetical protein